MDDNRLRYWGIKKRIVVIPIMTLLCVLSVGVDAAPNARCARAAPWVQEDPWHPDQQFAQRGDGDFELSVPAAHEMEIIPRVLALGSEAELLSPRSCRQRIAELVRGMAAKYER